MKFKISKDNGLFCAKDPEIKTPLGCFSVQASMSEVGSHSGTRRRTTEI